jgi:hypothetical protein
MVVVLRLCTHLIYSAGPRLSVQDMLDVLRKVLPLPEPMAPVVGGTLDPAANSSSLPEQFLLQPGTINVWANRWVLLQQHTPHQHDHQGMACSEAAEHPPCIHLPCVPHRVLQSTPPLRAVYTSGADHHSMCWCSAPAC